MSTPTIDASPATPDGHLPLALHLELVLQDAEMIRELTAHPEGRAREEYAVRALKIGLLALQQARGQIDAESVQRAGDRLLQELDSRLQHHAHGLTQQLASSLKEYFDPDSGRLQERITRLIRKDGELEEVLRRQIGQNDSELHKTLLNHFGHESPLMKMLSPKESEGLLRLLNDTISNALMDQRAKVLTEFSLDNKESALSRLIQHLTENNVGLTKNLQSRIDDVVKEFSLDKKDSALSRLVEEVTKAKDSIHHQFSLDNPDSAMSRMQMQLASASEKIDDHLTLDKETSALARLKRELTEMLYKHHETVQKFQEEVKVALAEMRKAKEVSERSTLHGRSFEQSVYALLQQEAQAHGEVASFVGHEAGLIAKAKVGDIVIELGADAAAAGARIVFEAKEDASYRLDKARLEIVEARKNRDAGVGVFVFSAKTAPAGIEPFQRQGDDLFVVWDSEDARTDLYLQAALMVARALCTRKAKHLEACTADFTGMEKAINEIEQRSEKLEEIHTWATTIHNNSDKIIKSMTKNRAVIMEQVEILRQRMQDLKATWEQESA